MRGKLLWGRPGVFIILATVLLILSAGAAQGQGLERVRFGQVSIASFLAMYIALEKGYFESEGIKGEPQEIIIFKVFPAIAAGDLIRDLIIWRRILTKDRLSLRSSPG